MTDGSYRTDRIPCVCLFYIFVKIAKNEKFVINKATGCCAATFRGAKGVFLRENRVETRAFPGDKQSLTSTPPLPNCARGFRATFIGPSKCRGGRAEQQSRGGTRVKRSFNGNRDRGAGPVSVINNNAARLWPVMHGLRFYGARARPR